MKNNNPDQQGFARGCAENVSLEQFTGNPKDRRWGIHKGEADRVADLYEQVREFEKRAARMWMCAGFLVFEKVRHIETGGSRLRLRRANFCKNRYCPVCQWRRSLMWISRFVYSLPQILEQYPEHPFLFLTLTVPNCPVSSLRETLQAMNKAWKRLLDRKQFSAVVGWVRTTEVNQEEAREAYAHPHFHVLLMVKPSYFGKGYVRRDEWLTAWQGAMRDPSITQVDIRRVKGDLIKAVKETFKYTVKPVDLVREARQKGEVDEQFLSRIERENPWLYELTRQTSNLRYIAAGGVFKDFLKKSEKVEEETDEDLIGQSEVSDWEAVENEPMIMAKWDKNRCRYFISEERCH